MTNFYQPKDSNHQYVHIYLKCRDRADLLDLFGAALPLYPAHSAASIQLLAQLPELPLSVLHVGSHLFQTLHSAAVQLPSAAELLRRLMPDHLELVHL